MARVPYVDRADLPKDMQHLAGSTSNITRAMSNAPYVAYNSGNIAKFVREGMSVDKRLIELGIIQVGYSMRSPYEYSHHVQVGLAVGLSDRDILAIAIETANGKSHLDPLSRTVLRAAREISDSALSKGTFDELRRDLSNEQIVELIFAISNYTGVCRILASLEVDVEDEYQTYLERFPLPN